MHGRFINGLVSLPNPTPLLRHFHFRPLLLQLFAGLDIGQCVALTQRLTDKRLVRPSTFESDFNHRADGRIKPAMIIFLSAKEPVSLTYSFI
ncbi:hypothetical protein KKJ03_03550 [Xenorhabdus bovienii]|nr:hypothetical protein [Xenorhabdus bovienii]MDE9460495.1 hypothetical protein [Xenorhabdus bovienii]MDE9468809.1 hypothetical protein [Xenorhabdus bovienii]